MKHQNHLNDDQLLTKLKHLAQQERSLVTEMLHLLRQVEDRGLHLAMGYTNLYIFCERELGLSEGQAYPRIQSMRLLRDMPEVQEKLESGEMSFSVAAKAQQCILKQKIQSPQEKADLIETLSGTSVRQAQRKIAELFPGEPEPEWVRPVSPEFTRIQFDAPQEMMEQIRHLQGLWGASNIQEVLQKAVSLAMKGEKKKKTVKKAKSTQTAEIDKDKDKTEEKTGRARTSWVKAKVRNRYIPIATRRAVWDRDGGECQYRDPKTGLRCASRHGLQVDHIHPYAKGGSHNLENLQLLCRNHNRWKDDPRRPH